MGRRIDDRVPNELSIRIWGMDSAGRPFSSQARTIDITRTGARITGIDHICQKGDVIGIQHGEQKARFRVVWVGNPRSEEHTSELQSRFDLVCRLLLEKKKKENNMTQQ